MKNNKKLNKQKRMALSIILAAVVLVALLIVILKLTAEKEPASSGLDRDDFYSEELCRCLERERPYCIGGYELEENFCVNKTLGTYTNVVKGCSKYECSGIIYEFNPGIDAWEEK